METNFLFMGTLVALSVVIIATVAFFFLEKKDN